MAEFIEGIKPWWMDNSGFVTPNRFSSDESPVLVIDGSLAQIEAIQRALLEAGIWKVIPVGAEDGHAYRRGQLVEAFRRLLDPKPYREHPGDRVAPWPVVAECHSRHVEGHECPQCSWQHDHDWVAWVHPKGPSWPPNATPIRCSKCGGRKCDLDLCDKRRHDGHDHQGGDS